LSAAVRRVSATPQSDSTGGGGEQRPAPESEAREQPPPAAPPERTAREPKEGETVHFTEVQPVAAAASEDSIAGTLTYNSPINKVNPPQSPSKFGQTSPSIAVNRSTATYENRIFKVQLVVDNKIDYWVHGGGRTNVASDSDPNIT